MAGGTCPPPRSRRTNKRTAMRCRSVHRRKAAILACDLFSDRRFAALPALGQLLFLVLLAVADDQGRLRADPDELRLLLPAVRISVEQMIESIDSIAKRGLA